MINLFVLLLLTVTSQTFGNSVTDGTKLISTILIHRHGDRTPISSTTALSTDPDAVEAASAPFGYGQLTDVGKRRAYKLGQAIRARYDELLSEQYNKSEIYIRSTDCTRTKMTVLTAMAAVYPSYPGSWSDEISWVPTPYTTVPAKYDFNLFYMNCPTFLTAYTSLFSSDSSRMDKYFDVLNTVSAASGYNITTMPVMAYSFLDVYVSQADNLIAGTDTPRVRIYSAHDFNVYAFEATAQVTPRQGVPGYTSSLALELRQIEKTEEYVVLPVYQSEPTAELIYLPVAGCDSLLCPYDTYKEIVSTYTLDEDTWRTECGFTDDLVVDDSGIA